MPYTSLSNRRGDPIDATFHPAPNTGYLALLGHGVTGNKDRPLIVGVATELAKLGIPCLRFSFAGNGSSGGRFQDCTITSETEDLEDILNQVYDSDTHIIYIGHSMGGAVGTLVAEKEPKRIQSLVSLAGMVHTREFFEREFGDVTPDDGFMWDESTCPLSQKAWDDATQTIVSTLPSVKKITQPWLLIHGTEDDVVPISDSREAFEAATTNRKELLERPHESHMFSEKSYSIIAQAIARWI